MPLPRLGDWIRLKLRPDHSPHSQFMTCVFHVVLLSALLTFSLPQVYAHNDRHFPPPPPPPPPFPPFRPPPPPPPPWYRDRYVLTQNYLPHNLTEGFEFRTAADYPGTGDPTNGFVNYVSHATARARGLVKLVRGRPDQGAPFNPFHHRHEQLYLGVDHTNVLPYYRSSDASSNVSSNGTVNGTLVNTTSHSASGTFPPVQGRDSIRLESKRVFNRGLLIGDFAHMPGNQCGVWPAFWTYNMEEDPIGEIDIVEGINHQPDNIVSLHTGQTCRFEAGWQTGTDQRPDCALMLGNQTNDDGCGMTAARPASYGTAFNRAGGGVYATLLDDYEIRIWHWPRHAVPLDVRRGRPEPWTWGRPLGDMTQRRGGCDVAENFHTLTIIINTDFCGDNESDDIWTSDKACAAYPSCPEYVASQPEAFRETYWLVNSIKVYEPRGKWPHWPPSPPPHPVIVTVPTVVFAGPINAETSVLATGMATLLASAFGTTYAGADTDTGTHGDGDVLAANFAATSPTASVRALSHSA
ncbi:glycoside hydrolase family 16 protein [Niveomyces insectorum RCEF 264]|uniref:Glycoside hydrolase family 16 protein n=1 Tax=Niveomyces insectorum RCEF 264 TaxID=1081102 RepID=A0A167S1Z7_9HYPO|nr:glycoside hydrolase family 16 protein [Niveomyces insectorum RCEF 264]